MQILVRYEPAPGTLAAGQHTVARCTDEGVLLVSGVGGAAPIEVVQEVPLSYDSIAGGLAASGVIRASAGTLLDCNCFNASPFVRYFQLFNSIAVPPNGTIPATIPITVQAGRHRIQFPSNSVGRAFSTGISWASSTTQLTLNLTGVPDMIVNAQHRA